MANISGRGSGMISALSGVYRHCIRLLILSALLLSPASALERIEYDPRPCESKTAGEAEYPVDTRLLCPMAPPIVVPYAGPSQPAALAPTSEPLSVRGASAKSSQIPAPAKEGSRLIRIALNTKASKADLIVPDGAQIIEESTQRLIAELPPQSRWQISIETGPTGRRFAVRGTISNVASRKLLLARVKHNIEQATFTRSFKVTGKGFSSPPEVVDSNTPVFGLPVRLANPIKPLPQSEGFKLASFQTTPSALSSQSRSVSPPKVVSGYLVRPPEPDGVVSCDGRTYRGSVILKPRSGEANSFLIINQLDLEDYLLSVVPAEMPSGWNLEALKAQAIAARSYALANAGKHQSEGYDLKANSEDQDYRGVQTESEATNRAVAETAGLVVKYEGKVVSAFFHSAGGGHTERSENVYGSKVPYLKSVPDFDDQSPHFNWNRNIPVAVIEQNLKKQGYDIGGLLGIFPLERSLSQRVTSAMLAGTLQTILVSGEDLRRLLSLPSTLFNVGNCPEAYQIAGRGFGHGLGMSQWGAKYLSEQGYNASQILSYYYKDVTVEQF